MAKVYIITDADIEALLSAFKEDPRHTSMSDAEKALWNEQYRRVNYKLHTWLNEHVRRS